MDKITKITILILILCAAIVQAATQDISVEVKARILYGNEPEQLKVSWQKGDSPYNEGILGIAVDKEGSIYIANIGGKVKKYSSSGEFIYDTEGIIDGLWSFTVSDIGEVISYSTRAMRDKTIIKFDIDGVCEWEKPFDMIINKDQIKVAEDKYGVEIEREFGGYIVTLSDGSIIAGIKARKKPSSLYYGLHMTSEGDFIEVIPYFPSRANDGWVVFESNETYDGIFSAEVLVSKDMKTISRRVKLDMNAEREIPFSGIYTVYSDQHEGFWAICHADSEPYYITSTVIRKSNLVLNHFDEDGSFTGEWLLQDTPFKSIDLSNITVAPNGYVYHLQFDEEGVNVVAYRSPAYNSSSSGKANSLYGLSSRNIDGVLYTPLRSLASAYGYKIHWNNETKTTMISNREKKISISNRTAVVRTEELEKREPINILTRDGIGWISAEDAASVLSMPVQTDKTNRVAYLIK